MSEHLKPVRSSILHEARAEAERRYPPDHIVDDPTGATGQAHTDEYGYQDCARQAFIAGVEWATSLPGLMFLSDVDLVHESPDCKGHTTPLSEATRARIQRGMERFDIRPVQEQSPLDGTQVVHDGPSEAMLQLPDGRILCLQQLGGGRQMWNTPADNEALCEAIASVTNGVKVTHGHRPA